MASSQQLAWLSSVVPAAVASQQSSGVPASVTLAQCILESGWGTTQLAKEANNYFGIKAEHLSDPSTYEEFPTAEYIHGQRVMIDAKFEKYPDMEASFADHARLISSATRYASAMAVRNDPFAFAIQLQKDGYSTSPTYGTTLGELIHSYNLAQHDIQEPQS